MQQLMDTSRFMRLCARSVFANNIPISNVICNKGNHKIPRTTAIFNFGAASNCPSFALSMCNAFSDGKHICYALKAERQYPNIIPKYRHRQEKFWKNTDAETFVFQFLLVNALKKKPFTALRFNESGDFWSQECVDKAEIIARRLKQYGIICYCYTARSDLDYRYVRALRISGSGFQKKGITNIFQIITDKKEKPKGYGMCPMNCRVCTRCLKSGMRTCVIKH